jgi:hypothetical protein
VVRRRRFRAWWPSAALLGSLLAAASALATPHLPDDTYKALPCRPTIACTADLVPPGALEIELGYQARRLAVPLRGGAPPGGEPAAFDHFYQHATPLLLKLTVFEWLQAQVGTSGPVLARGRASYIDDLVTGFKFHLWDQGRIAPSVAFSVTAGLPVWPRVHGFIPSYDVLTTLYITRDLGPVHADLNGGLNVWDVTSPRPQGYVALALSTDLPWHLTPMLEGYYFSSAVPVTLPDAGVLMAMAYAVKPWLVVDAGGDVGLVRSTRSFTLFVGMTVIAVDFWETAREAKEKALRTRGH